MKRLLKVEKSALQGSIVIPPSKSHTMRAILFGLMGNGTSFIRNYLPSKDTDFMIKAVSQFGAKVTIHPDFLEIEGGELKTPLDVIQAGNSGLVLRLMGGIAALLSGYTVITGDPSIRTLRPAAPLIDALTQMGCTALSTRGNGLAPLIIKGPITHFEATLSGEDSQPVSALLIAASFLKRSSRLHVINPGERPWIDMTLDWLQSLGMNITHENYSSYFIEGGGSYKGFDRTMPGDFSSAAYPLVAALITGSEVTLKGLAKDDIQGDKKLIDFLLQMGAHLEWNGDALVVKKGGVLKGISLDVNDCIDMITILPVLACFAEGKTEIRGGSIARCKESDRIQAIITELSKMGALIEEKEDGMIITPGPLKGAHLNCYEDHRIGLSLAVAALGAVGESKIEGIECVQKTFPHFIKSFVDLGALFE